MAFKGVSCRKYALLGKEMRGSPLSLRMITLLPYPPQYCIVILDPIITGVITTGGGEVSIHAQHPRISKNT